MRFLVAEHRLPGRRQRRERQRIGGGAGGDEKDRRLALEDFGEPRLGARGEVVGAVGGRVDAARGRDRIEDRRRHARRRCRWRNSFLPIPEAAPQPRLSCPLPARADWQSAPSRRGAKK